MTVSSTHAERHAEAMLNPEGVHERCLVGLYTALIRMCDLHHQDTEVIPAIEALGRSIILLLNQPRGRLDGGFIDKAVRDAVRRAGGNSDEL